MKLVVIRSWFYEVQAKRRNILAPYTMTQVARIFFKAIREFPDHPAMGTREIFGEEEEKQKDGKVNRYWGSVIICFLYYPYIISKNYDKLIFVVSVYY